MSPFVLSSVIAVEILIAAVLTYGIRKIAPRIGLMDVPTESRKIHSTPIPLGGGIALIISWLIGVCLVLVWPWITHGYILPKHLVGLSLASLVILVGGFLDDRYHLAPRFQMLTPIVAILIVISSGIGISTISNPFGDVIALDTVRITLFTIHGLPYAITLFADLFAFVWLMGMMYTTKLLDGIDGLVASMTAIGGIFLALLSFSDRVNQPETGVLALMLSAVCFGFLLFNWHPASIFLGEAGSLFTGFILGVLSIFSGAKIATTLLIFALPILDVVWVIGRRVLLEKHSPFIADRLHLHQRLLDAGFSQRQTVGVLLLLTVIFGACGLLFETSQKITALCIAAACMVVLGALLSKRKKHSS